MLVKPWRERLRWWYYHRGHQQAACAHGKFAASVMSAKSTKLVSSKFKNNDSRTSFQFGYSTIRIILFGILTTYLSFIFVSQIASFWPAHPLHGSRLFTCRLLHLKSPVWFAGSAPLQPISGCVFPGFCFQFNIGARTHEKKSLSSLLLTEKVIKPYSNNNRKYGSQ